jgi:1-acyl-sn-glycerol-3-phosphate acyltransferase
MEGSTQNGRSGLSASGLAGAFLGAGRSVAGRVGHELAERVKGRISKVDLDDRDPDYIRESLPGLWLLTSFYFRADVRGLDRIPAEGPVLLVGNHSGGNVTPDTLVFSLAFNAYFGAERRFYQLVHNLVLAMPSPIPLRKYGSVPASHENARAALERGAALLVYPGGDWEVHRPSWESGTVDFAGRKGFVKLALDQDVPIVPIVAIGGQETALFLTRGDRLAKALGLDRLFRLKVLPISLALPWIVNVGDMLTHWPLPAKITVEALEPIDLRERFGKDPDVDEVYDHVTGLMQAKLDELSAARRLPLIG